MVQPTLGDGPRFHVQLAQLSALRSVADLHNRNKGRRGKEGPGTIRRQGHHAFALHDYRPRRGIHHCVALETPEQRSLAAADHHPGPVPLMRPKYGLAEIVFEMRKEAIPGVEDAHVGAQ